VADYAQPEYVEKRLRFFDGQFLKDQDFVDEQKYHLDRQRRHNRFLHSAGIVDGLAVTIPATATATVAVGPGVAVDRRGRQIVLATAANVSLAAFLGQAAVVWISSRDEPADPATTGSGDTTRWWEHPLIEAVREGQQPQGQDAIALGRATLTAQGGVTLDLGVRVTAGVRLPDGATASVTLRALAPNRAELGGGLSVRGHLTLEPGSSPSLYTGTGTSELNRYLQLVNSPDSGTASGLKVGGVLVSDTYTYANPPKNDLIVKGNVGIGTPTPENAGNWNKVLDILGAGLAKLSVRTAAVYGGAWVHDFGSWGAPAGMIVGTNSAHPISFVTNTDNRLTISAAGTVGIGTAIPAGRLTIKMAGGGWNDGLVVEKSDNANRWQLAFDVGDRLLLGYNGMARMSFLGGSGNVGIGVNDPQRKLQLGTDVSGIGLEPSDAGPNAGYVRFGDNTGWKLHFGRSREAAGGALNAGVAGVLLTVQDNGRVGIGTVTPTAPLQIVGGNWDLGNSEGDLKIGDDTYRLKIGVSRVGGGAGDVRIRAHGGTGRLMLGSGTTDVLSIQGGNVGIGTLTPRAKFDVSGAGATINAVAVGTDVPGIDYSFEYETVGVAATNANLRLQSPNWVIVHSGAALTPRMVITDGGSVGIGTTSPGARLDVSGSGASQCCAQYQGQPYTPTLALSEDSRAANRPAWLQFHNANEAEGYIRLAGGGPAGSGRDGPRRFEIGSSQQNMTAGLRISGDMDIAGNLSWGGDQSPSGYVRLGSVQICWGRGVVTTSQRQTEQGVNFPQAFAGAPAVTISIDDPGFGDVSLRGSFGAYQVIATSFIAVYKNSIGSSHTVNYYWMAIGRWR
jgi:hypothetical protein